MPGDDSAFVAGYERKQGHPDPAEDLAVLAAHGWTRPQPWSTSVLGRVGSRSPHAGSATSPPLASPLAMLELLRHRAAAAGVLRLRDLIYDLQPSEAEAVFERWLEGAADDPTRGYTRADFAEHIRSEHSTFRWLLEPMLAAAGFEIVTADCRGSVYGAYTCCKG